MACYNSGHPIESGACQGCLGRLTFIAAQRSSKALTIACSPLLKEFRSASFMRLSAAGGKRHRSIVFSDVPAGEAPSGAGRRCIASCRGDGRARAPHPLCSGPSPWRPSATEGPQQKAVRMERLVQAGAAVTCAGRMTLHQPEAASWGRCVAHLADQIVGRLLNIFLHLVRLPLAIGACKSAPQRGAAGRRGTMPSNAHMCTAALAAVPALPATP